MKIGKKTAVTRELTRQERNRRNNIKRLTVSFIVAFILFIALLVIQSSILNQEEKKQVFQVIKDLPTGTKIDESNIDGYLQLKEVQLSLVPEGCITEKEDVLNKFTNRDYKAKDVITSDGITDTEKLYKDSIENPTELSFSVGDSASAVAGTIHEGDYINIYGLRKDAFNKSGLEAESEELILTDEYFTFMHIYIVAAYNGDGTRISTDDTEQKATMFNIILSEKDVNTFNEMLKNCDIMIAKVLYESDKNYLDFIKEVNMDAASFIKEKKESKSKDNGGGEGGGYWWDIDLSEETQQEDFSDEVEEVKREDDVTDIEREEDNPEEEAPAEEEPHEEEPQAAAPAVDPAAMAAMAAMMQQQQQQQ